MKSDSNAETHYISVMNSIDNALIAADIWLSQMECDSEILSHAPLMSSVALQIRMICEFFILASTLAHLEDGADINVNLWKPKDAFREIEKYNLWPLPMPIEREYKVVAGRKQITPLSKPMPFDLLNSIHGQCGNFVHVPSADKILNEKIQPFIWNLFRNWVDGFKIILKGHILLLPNIKRILVFWGVDGVDERPTCILLEGDGEAIFSFENLNNFTLIEI